MASSITKELCAFIADVWLAILYKPGSLVVQQFAMPTCLVYPINAKRKICLLLEKPDLVSLMKQFNRSVISTQKLYVA